MEEIEFEENHLIYNEGDPSNALYIVLSGSVTVAKGDHQIAVIETNKAFGVWALFDEEPRLSKAVAREHTRLLRIDREDFFESFQ